MMMPSIFEERFFDDLFDFPAFAELPGPQPHNGRPGRLMKTDVKEADDHFEISIDLPGFKKEELSLELTDGYLTIKAAKGLDKDEKEKKTGKYINKKR